LFTPDELQTLNPMDINAFDRLATGKNSMKAHYASNVPLYGSYALPVLFLADKETRRDFPQILSLFSETILLNAGVTFLMKSTFRRPRPYVFDPNVDLTRKQKRNAKASFVSGHTSTTAANTFFMAKVYSDYFPDSKLKPYVWGSAIVVPAVTGYLRVRAGRHYPTDTIAGYIIGAAAGYFVTYLHRNTD
ncbi:MAG: phosphatase PAP2 family protein, partial [Bacteroidota bacterium]